MIRSVEDESCEQFERRMLTSYHLDEPRLRRLAIFFLVHSHIDIKLIALVVKAETVKLSQIRALSYDDHTLLSLKWSRGTFQQHLRNVTQRSLLGPDELRIADETNRARDHFVHFEVGRFELPHYFGNDVTTDEGYRTLHHRRYEIRCKRSVPELLIIESPK
jgi:hypothetical protein